MTSRYLIVNADDFGLSEGVNRGVIQGHECGIVTSASIMVHGQAVSMAAAYGRARPEFSIGLHVDLSEWTYTDHRWIPVYERVQLEDRQVVAEEVSRQLSLFRRLLHADPTHLDSHQHVHRHAIVQSVLFQIAQDLNIPLRQHCAVRYCGAFYGQTVEGVPLPDAISRQGLCTILKRLPSGVSEMSCHPGEGSDLNMMYSIERSQELQVLCDPSIRDAIHAEGIELRSFSDIDISSLVLL
jgi:predicted glycoside hydrolase/deacetylase ChbG (UPF0249 family)